MTNTMMMVLAILVVGLLGACGGTDIAPFEESVDSGKVDVEAQDAVAPDAGPDADPVPTGIEACKAWEQGPQPIEAMAECVTRLGASNVACAEATRTNWHTSCAGDCVGSQGDYMEDLDCYCECMVVYGNPYDGDAGDNCAVNYADLYDCWMEESGN